MVKDCEVSSLVKGDNIRLGLIMWVISSNYGLYGQVGSDETWYMQWGLEAVALVCWIDIEEGERETPERHM